MRPYPQSLPERIHPDLVIIHQGMRPVNLPGRHFLAHLFLAVGRIRVSADGAEHIPHICAHQIRSGHAETRLVIPPDARLGTWMPFHRRAQIPFEGTFVIPFDPQPQRVHHTDQFLRVGISRPGRRPERGACLFERARFHQISRLFDFCQDRG